MIICIWKSQRMGTSNLKLMLISWTWCSSVGPEVAPLFTISFECKKKKKKNQKLAGLWLAGEVVNHVGIYGSKAAEGLSAFQRRSCYSLVRIFGLNVHNNIVQKPVGLEFSIFAPNSFMDFWWSKIGGNCDFWRFLAILQKKLMWQAYRVLSCVYVGPYFWGTFWTRIGPKLCRLSLFLSSLQLVSIGFTLILF